MIKKGAMFGLDARIALAIFGALSVISGAALYSAIQESKVVNIVVELEEIAKAMEAYYLDTGVELEPYKISNLVKSTASGWKGPYINHEVNPGDTTQILLKGLPTISMYNTRMSDEDFPDDQNSVVCTGTNRCYHWLALSESLSDNGVKAVWDQISKKLDGNSSLLTGKVRLMNTATHRYFYYQLMPVQNN